MLGASPLVSVAIDGLKHVRPHAAEQTAFSRIVLNNASVGPRQCGLARTSPSPVPAQKSWSGQRATHTYSRHEVADTCNADPEMRDVHKGRNYM